MSVAYIKNYDLLVTNNSLYNISSSKRITTLDFFENSKLLWIFIRICTIHVRHYWCFAMYYKVNLNKNKDYASEDKLASVHSKYQAQFQAKFYYVLNECSTVTYNPGYSRIINYVKALLLQVPGVDPMYGKYGERLRRFCPHKISKQQQRHGTVACRLCEVSA